MAGGSFSFSPVSRYTSTGQAEFVLNVGFTPEASGSSCSLVCKEAKDGCGMEDLAFTDGSTSGVRGSRCEASSRGRYSDWDGCEVLRYCCDPSSGDHLVLNRLKSSSSGVLMDAFNATCNSNCGSPCISWNGPNSQSLSAYMDASCITANLNMLSNETVRDADGQTAFRAANPSQGRSREFKPDDASSHNNNNILWKRSADVDASFSRDLEVEDLAVLSESINDSLLLDGRAEGQKKEKEQMKSVVKGSKRKAAEALKNPTGAEVQSEERNIRSQNESRIVRVSRMNGGKDRHSKVRTARGLRDRRVRLSVPTAIQFYDLQDRLGYEQPSMAVDWLMNAAKAAIDDLPPIADASNISQMTYSNRSPVKSGVGSPKESARGQEVGVKNESKIFSRAVHEQLPVRSTKDSHVGRSGSSTSDGSIMGTEYSSKTSLSKLERLKVARERARIKARNPSACSQVPNTNIFQSSVSGHLMNVVTHDIPPQESCSFRNGILWDYSMQDISSKEQSRQFQHMAAPSLSSISTAASLQQQSTGYMEPLLRSSFHQSFDMADSATAFMDPKQRSVVGNAAAQMYFNALVDHQSTAMQKHLGSTFVSGEVNFTTSDHSIRGPLQSNSSCITTSNTLLQKNAFADASAKVSMLPFLAIPERFQTNFLDGNAKYEVNH